MGWVMAPADRLGTTYLVEGSVAKWWTARANLGGAVFVLQATLRRAGPQPSLISGSR